MIEWSQLKLYSIQFFTNWRETSLLLQDGPEWRTINLDLMVGGCFILIHVEIQTKNKILSVSFFWNIQRLITNCWRGYSAKHVENVKYFQEKTKFIGGETVGNGNTKYESIHGLVVAATGYGGTILFAHFLILLLIMMLDENRL